MSRAAFTGWIRHPPDDRDLTRTMGPPLLKFKLKISHSGTEIQGDHISVAGATRWIIFWSRRVANGTGAGHSAHQLSTATTLRDLSRSPGQPCPACRSGSTRRIHKEFCISTVTNRTSAGDWPS
jgi:hypothetical protein